MRVFPRLRRTAAPSLSEVNEIRERVRKMRQQIGVRDIELAHLFALLGEDERPIGHGMAERRVETRRLWPHEVPSNPALWQPDAEATYGDPEALRRTSPFKFP